jgi:hypothetical protein
VLAETLTLGNLHGRGLDQSRTRNRAFPAQGDRLEGLSDACGEMFRFDGPYHWRSLLNDELPIDRDVLRLGEFAETVVRPFASQSALLHPTERRGWVGDRASIQSAHSAVDPLGDLQTFR